eukprot:2967271-Lingulodinium_polyedra.AAC.1
MSAVSSPQDVAELLRLRSRWPPGVWGCDERPCLLWLRVGHGVPLVVGDIHCLRPRASFAQCSPIERVAQTSSFRASAGCVA